LDEPDEELQRLAQLAAQGIKFEARRYLSSATPRNF
jgi:hypothetical protein